MLHSTSVAETAMQCAMLCRLPSAAAPGMPMPWLMRAGRRYGSDKASTTHSLVMKLMNSLTHSCTVSFASLAIFAFAGSAFFIMRLMFAMGRKRSCRRINERQGIRNDYARECTDMIRASRAMHRRTSTCSRTLVRSSTPSSSPAIAARPTPGPRRPSGPPYRLTAGPAAS